MKQRTSTSRVFAVIALATLASCVLFDHLWGTEEVFAFDHAAHMEELDCSDCHSGVEDSDDPGIPVKAQCMLCHADTEEEQPPERRIESLFDGNQLRRTPRKTLSSEVKFSHLTHVTALQDCSSCHKGIEQNHNVARLAPVSMAACQACHESSAVANECSTCHTQIDQAWAPPGHETFWVKRHGLIAREESPELLDDCALCHRSDTCNSCHKTMAPDNHTDFWRRRGHFITARADRTSCAICHLDQSCASCHAVSRPLSHTGFFGGSAAQHCNGCHFPLSSQGCITCHKSTPGHMQAAPLPSDPPHSLAANCRQCHGSSAPLPHPDKGDECILCHK